MSRERILLCGGLRHTLSATGQFLAGWVVLIDQIYVKISPPCEARQVTDDRRWKYGPMFSPDGSPIAYTAIQDLRFVTSVVSVLGGDSHLFLNYSSLSWLDRDHLLFSRIRSTRLHMGIVTGAVGGQHFRELYFPARERAMAHYSCASPDRKVALLVEMDGRGSCGPCRIISLDGRFGSRQVGPAGPCISTTWSPDGSLMYFSAEAKGESRRLDHESSSRSDFFERRCGLVQQIYHALIQPVPHRETL